MKDRSSDLPDWYDFDNADKTFGFNTDENQNHYAYSDRHASNIDYWFAQGEECAANGNVNYSVDIKELRSS